MRAVVALALTITASCSPSHRVEMTGDRFNASLIRKLVEAAEERDLASYSRLIGKSGTMSEWFPPAMDEIDRRDEGCVLKRIDGEVAKIAEAVWNCPGKNYKQEVERKFLIENGRVTHMWNDWGEGLL